MSPTEIPNHSPVQGPLRRRTDPHGTAKMRARRVEVILMASIACWALYYCRSSYDNRLVMLGEMLIGGFALLLGARFQMLRAPRALVASKTPANLAVPVIVIAVVVMPWLSDLLARRFGFGNGLEIVMLSSLSWGGLAGSMLGRRTRALQLSVICSGFLTLFNTFLSDSSLAFLFAYAWGFICLWWLVSNHWDQFESFVAVDVKPNFSRSLVPVFGGSLLFLLTAILVANRVPVLKQLSAEAMPTSGGSTINDDAARKGVGTGNLLLAAKSHANSFGAVETDVFLDSDQPSLFDIFSDQFGEPITKKRVERTQALSLPDVQSDETKVAESNRSSSTEPFSTDRKPPRQRSEAKDQESNALMYWSGQLGIGLAVRKYDQFDGVDWTASTKTKQSLRITQLADSESTNGRIWFMAPDRGFESTLSPFVDALPEAIKFTRFRSNVIPVRQGLKLWSIEKITEADFFSYSRDDTLEMTGREHVPDYTVVRTVNGQIELERLENLAANCSPQSKGQILDLVDDSQHSVLISRMIRDLATPFFDQPRGWGQIESVIDHFRGEYAVLPAQGGEPQGSDNRALAGFLERRIGPDYLFATAAALTLRQLGYETRMVAGFYVNPSKILPTREVAILPSDAHTWLEVNVGHGYWVPVEPTPGYRKPPTTASLWYQLNKSRIVIGQSIACAVFTGIGLWLSRKLLFDIGCYLAWPFLLLLDDRRRTAWLIHVLDKRLGLIGCDRPIGVLPRQFLQTRFDFSAGLWGHSFQLVFTAADQLHFGHGEPLSREARSALRHLWFGLTSRHLRTHIFQPPKSRSESPKE